MLWLWLATAEAYEGVCYPDPPWLSGSERPDGHAPDALRILGVVVIRGGALEGYDDSSAYLCDSVGVVDVRLDAEWQDLETATVGYYATVPANVSLGRLYPFGSAMPVIEPTIRIGFEDGLSRFKAPLALIVAITPIDRGDEWGPTTWTPVVHPGRFAATEAVTPLGVAALAVGGTTLLSGLAWWRQRDASRKLETSLAGSPLRWVVDFLLLLLTWRVATEGVGFLLMPLTPMGLVPMVPIPQPSMIEQLSWLVSAMVLGQSGWVMGWLVVVLAAGAPVVRAALLDAWQRVSPGFAMALTAPLAGLGGALLGGGVALGSFVPSWGLLVGFFVNGALLGTVPLALYSLLRLRGRRPWPAFVLCAAVAGLLAVYQWLAAIL
ncbi:MAG: hypothetical protein AAF602_13485 [Myxococcota bacterium]